MSKLLQDTLMWIFIILACFLFFTAFIEYLFNEYGGALMFSIMATAFLAIAFFERIEVLEN